MYLKGYRDGSSNLYLISAFIHNKNIVSNAIHFVIDTGATQTALSVRDSIKLNLLSLNTNTLELISKNNCIEEKIYTGNGIIDALKLSDVMLTFYISKTSYIAEYLNSIYITKPRLRNIEEYEIFINNPSVLGMDILKNYKIQFDKDIVLLER